MESFGLREARIRQLAAAEGLYLDRPLGRPRRTRHDYRVIDPARRAVVATGSRHGQGLSLDEVEAFLVEERQFEDDVMALLWRRPKQPGVSR